MFAAAYVALFLVARVVVAFDATSPLFVAQHSSGEDESSMISSLTAWAPAPSFVSNDKLDEVLGALSCFPRVILVVNQPKVHFHEIQRFARVMPNFRATFTTRNPAHSIKSPYVMGGVTSSQIQSLISAKCHEDYISIPLTLSADSDMELERNRVVYTAELEPFDGSELSVIRNDERIGEMMDLLRNKMQIGGVEGGYVVVFTSSEVKDLRRRSLQTASVFSSTAVTGRIPFSKQTILQKYILFGNGIFEGAGAVLLFLIIAIFGVNALGSLQTPTKFETSSSSFR